jgi:hypothetical protein
MLWTYEPMYIARDERGIIIRIQENRPEDFETNDLASEDQAYGNDCPNGSCDI